MYTSRIQKFGNIVIRVFAIVFESRTGLRLCYDVYRNNHYNNYYSTNNIDYYKK